MLKKKKEKKGKDKQAFLDPQTSSKHQEMKSVFINEKVFKKKQKTPVLNKNDWQQNVMLLFSDYKGCSSQSRSALHTETRVS